MCFVKIANNKHVKSFTLHDFNNRMENHFDFFAFYGIIYNESLKKCKKILLYTGGEINSMTEVIAVTSGKGGTGKSTVCAGLGNALANSGFSVVILELDFGFRCLDLFFGISSQVESDISDYISGRCRLKECVNKIPAVPGLSIICAPTDFSAEFDCEKIAEAVSQLKNLYDFVLIDTGAGADKKIIRALTEADRIFFVVTPDNICIRDVSRLSDEFYRYGCDNQRLVINRVHKKYIDYGIVDNLDTVIDKSGIQLIGVVPEDNALTLFYGKSAGISDGSPGYNAFMAIVRRICGENAPLTIK